jgi:hypothetical protein
VRVEHLDAALAVWRYASESARWGVGDSLGNPTADNIWEMAKASRTASLALTLVTS